MCDGDGEGCYDEEERGSDMVWVRLVCVGWGCEYFVAGVVMVLCVGCGCQYYVAGTVKCVCVAGLCCVNIQRWNKQSILTVAGQGRGRVRDTTRGPVVHPSRAAPFIIPAPPALVKELVLGGLCT